MWKGGALAKLSADAALDTKCLVHGGSQVVELLRRHACLKEGNARLVRGGSDVVCALHERDLGGGFDRAAGDGHRISADEFEVGGLLADAVRDKVARAFFHTDTAAVDATVRQDLGDELVGAFVLLPRADVVAKEDLLAQTGLFEAGPDVGDLSPGGDHSAQHSLAAPPADACKVEQPGAGLEEQGVDAVVDHQPAGLVDAGEAFLHRDGRYAVCHGLECAKQVLGHVIPPVIDGMGMAIVIAHRGVHYTTNAVLGPDGRWAIIRRVGQQDLTLQA